MFILLPRYFSLLFLLWHGVPSTGFPLLGTNTGCGGKLTETEGTFSTPGYPQKYPKNIACLWIISNDAENSTVQVSFSSFKLENHPQCRYDYLIVRDGGSELAPIIGKFCGNKVPQTIHSRGNSLWLRFYSDSVNTSNGFKALFSRKERRSHFNREGSKNSGDNCGRTLFGEAGEITSPDFPKQYPVSIRCVWEIDNNNNDASGIEVTFEAFDVEYTPNCLFDYVSIVEVSTESVQPAGRLCGGALLPPQRYTGNKIRIVFKTDESGTGSGFKLKWKRTDLPKTRVCGFAKTSAVGFIRSSQYPDNYADNENCQWTISAPAESMKIQLRFSGFDLERDAKCSYDYLAIFDGHDEAAPLIGKFCGAAIPPVINSTQQNMKVVFKTDRSDTRSGFEALWLALDNRNWRENELESKSNKIARSPTAKCGGLLTAANGSITTPNYPDEYLSNSACIWVITADRKYNVNLSFKSFNVEKHTSCDYDSVEVRDGKDMTSPLLGRFCGNEIPKDIISGDSSLWIQFKSDRSIEKAGMLATWKIIMKSGNVACGTTFRDNSGELSPPGYPQTSSKMKYCSWTIEVPKDKRIRLVFKEMRLRPTPGCASSYVQISDGSSNRDPDLGKFCRPALPRPVVSSTNKLFIGFQSDGFTAAHGFIVQWEAIGKTYVSNDVKSFSDSETNCGSTMTAESGDIVFRKGVRTCAWVIRPASGRRIALSIIKAAIIPNPSCDVERIDIQDGLTVLAPALARICGQQQKKHFTSSSGALRIQYDRSSESNGEEIRLFWTTAVQRLHDIPKEDSCENVGASRPGNLVSDTSSLQPNIPPWVAGLLLGPRMVSCGAAILSTSWLLTAAHCLRRYPWYQFGKIQLGSSSVSGKDETGHMLTIKTIHIHPSYNSETNEGDIALINLQDGIVLNERVKRVCLPKNDTDFAPNTLCTTAGWGTSRFLGEPSKSLVHATIPLVSKATCNTTGTYKGKIGENMICAGDKLGRNDTCQGDGGGPLTCKISTGAHVLVGISSWGSGCGYPERYGVYTEVRKYLDWISRTIERR